MSTSAPNLQEGSLLDALLSEDVFHPPQPNSLEDTGISPVLMESLVLKHLLQSGSSSGRDLAKRLCLPFTILEELLLALRSRQLLVHKGQAGAGDFVYMLTELGAERARLAMRSSG